MLLIHCYARAHKPLTQSRHPECHEDPPRNGRWLVLHRVQTDLRLCDCQERFSQGLGFSLDGRDALAKTTGIICALLSTGVS